MRKMNLRKNSQKARLRRLNLKSRNRLAAAMRKRFG
jgi:hypothetical protein